MFKTSPTKLGSIKEFLTTRIPSEDKHNTQTGTGIRTSGTERF
jgi:hypothetical protein